VWAGLVLGSNVIVHLPIIQVHAKSNFPKQRVSTEEIDSSDVAFASYSVVFALSTAMPDVHRPMSSHCKHPTKQNA
jgi:hypothetical protein